MHTYRVLSLYENLCIKYIVIYQDLIKHYGIAINIVIWFDKVQ